MNEILNTFIKRQNYETFNPLFISNYFIFNRM